jgi:VWFA-related protein
MMKKQENDVRVKTIPISIFTETELQNKETQEFVQAGKIIVKENQEEQTILSIRSVSNTPLSIAILIQDDLSSRVNLQLKDIKKFILNLPKDSRVMVAYLRSGTLQVRQKFTKDLEKAASSIRIVTSSSAVAPRNPYDGVISSLNRFDSLPGGRRAILLLSDGLDVSQGFTNSTPSMSNDLQRAILRAQKRSVAVYSFYSSASLTNDGNSVLVNNGQGSLNKLSKETGGKAFFQGTFTPVSYQPFFRDLNRALKRQFALTYLSTHMKKGYYKIEVTSTNPEVKIEHPKGYYYKK